MATEINWTITQLDRKLQHNDRVNVVITAHWRCIAIEPSGEEVIDANGVSNDILLTSEVYGATNFTIDENNNFIPYESLTKEQVLGWVWQTVNKEETEASLAAQIEAQKNPVSATGVPWDA